MYGENVCPNAQEPPDLPTPASVGPPPPPPAPAPPPSPLPSAPPHLPPLGALVVDTGRGDRVGEFRGVAGPYWSLRPVGGGIEWEAEPHRVRPALLIEQLRARTARLNARSRGEVL